MSYPTEYVNLEGPVAQFSVTVRQMQLEPLLVVIAGRPRSTRSYLTDRSGILVHWAAGVWKYDIMHGNAHERQSSTYLGKATRIKLSEQARIPSISDMVNYGSLLQQLHLSCESLSRRSILHVLL